MQIIDYSRSYMTFFAREDQGANIARIQLDASCEITGWHDSETKQFHLIAPCRSENMYLDGQLFQMPNYEFSGIFSDEQISLIRTHWTSDREQPEIADPNDRFDHIEFELVAIEAEELIKPEEVVAATLDNRRLVARTDLADADGTVTATLRYPIKTMNVTKSPPQFQIDTGPLIVPDFESTQPQPIRRFDIAHVVYCQPDRAEFVLRVPHNVANDRDPEVLVTDYSELRFAEARNTIWAERI